MSDLEQPIAMGRTAEIYPFENEKVLKLFYPTIPQSWINKEVDTGRYIEDAQLPVPKVYERVKLGKREGIVYERLEGTTLLHEIASKPWNIAKYARLQASLHAQVHKVLAPASIETQREWATGGLAETDKLPRNLQEKVLHLLASMPDGNQLCHGDFHPGNIVVTRRGPVIIDWMTASKGVACGDVARTSVILEAATVPEGTPMRWLLDWVRKVFLSVYLKTYAQYQPIEEDSLGAWRAIMAANFLADVSQPEEEGKLMAIVERGTRLAAGG